MLTGSNTIIAAALGIAFVVLAGLLVSLLLSVRKLKERYASLIDGVGVKNVEDALLSYLEASGRLEKRTEALEKGLRGLESEVSTHFQNFGMVRYNAFEGVGGEQSFSLALLDDSANGLVLTGIFGHAETRVYAKPIESGTSRYLISPEETRAIDAARKKNGK